MKKPQSSFIEVMGDSPYNRILDFLITQRGIFDYSTSEISKEADVAWVTTDKIIKNMLKEGIIKKTREVGRADMYMLNEKNPIAQTLIATFLLITKAMFNLEAYDGCLSVGYSVTDTSMKINMSRTKPADCAEIA